MSIKTLLLSLFLYVCLVWVGAFYLRSDDVVQFGLRWTAIGLIAVLAFIIGARIFGWWRLSRARASARPAAAAPVRPAQPAHEDDAALAALIAEANANLAKSPAYAAKMGAKGGTTPFAGMPLYLLIGPEGSGKTSTFVDSGLEPQLLAGQVSGTGPPMPTRLCNLWVAKDAIFAELSGRVFSGELARWTQLLKILRGGNSTVPMWRRLWREPEQGLALRGVIAFCDAKEFTGTPNSQALDRRSRDLQERLQAAGDVFGTDFPVYQVFAKSDAIPYFADFFRRLPEAETSQVFGCTFTLHESGGAQVSADEQSKRLARSFRPLYQELAKRRITQLAHEPDPARRPAVYEFPRELKRIRTPLLQFLSETFRPHPLRLGPLLRGYYLTGVREVEVAAANVSETRVDWAQQKMEATRLFSAADATRIFRPSEMGMGQKVGPRGMLVRRWIFASDLFKNVILADRPVARAAPVDSRLELYRRGIFAGVCGLCALLCIAFLWSATRNHSLLSEIRDAGAGLEQQPGKAPTRAELAALDAFRGPLQQLIGWDRGSTPWGLSWWLYTGSRVLDSARQAYFRRFRDLLLNTLNGEVVGQLQAVSLTPAGDEPYDPVYRLLQTHLMTAGSCTPDPAVVAQVLMDTRKNNRVAAGPSGEPELADTQIKFYANELPHENPPVWRVAEDRDARDRARQYLQSIKGIDRIYRNILSGVEGTLPKPQHLADLAPKYAEVLKGPAEPSGAFARGNWDAMESAFKKSNSSAAGDPCVVGTSSGAGGGTHDADDVRKLRGLYIADYIKRWRDYVQGFSVLGYKGPEDAARKLQILSDHNSPLLGLFFVTGTQTNFQTAPEESTLEKVEAKVPFIKKAFSSGKKAAQEAQKAGLAPTAARELTRADITQVFQPVQWVVPPTSEKWVGDKNSAYIDALDQLGQSMKAIATTNKDATVHAAALQNYDKAMTAAKQIARGFRSVGEDGLDSKVEALLEQPILYANGFIIKDMGQAEAGQKNGELRQLCAKLSVILRKYPFQPSSKDDISLEDLGKFFGPAGAIWQFQAKSLADVVVKEGTQWKASPTAKQQVTPDMLSFLNRAQEIADVFYPGGASQPLVYSLRPKPDSNLKDWTLTLTIDGQKVDWTPTSSLQKQFTWPAGPGKEPGAAGRIGTGAGGMSTPFASRGGPWGIFKIMGDAEARPPQQKVVEWKYLRSGEGRPEPLQPPVRLEIVGFPGGVDVFNPSFFPGLRCPSKAVQ